MSEINWGSLADRAKKATELVPDGDTDVEIEKAEAVKSTTGKDMIKLRLRVVGGPYDKRVLVTQQVLSPDSDFALAMFFQMMATFGLDNAFFAANPTLEYVAASLVGKRAVATIGHKTFNNREINEVKGYKAGATTSLGIPVPSGLSMGIPVATPTSAIPSAPMGSGPSLPPDVAF